MSAADSPVVPLLSIKVKWNGKQFTVDLEADATLGELKRSIEAATHVRPKRQKLLGVKPAKAPATAGGAEGGAAGGAAAAAALDDESVLSSVAFPAVLMMIGSPESAIEQLAADAEAAPEIADDFEDTPSAALAAALAAVADRPENIAKLRRRVAATPVAPLAPPRPGKKLLVLDIDYTLFDHRSAAERPEELARPHLHSFLAAAYGSFDIVIWSATSMRWVEEKMRSLGVLGHSDYRITALLDHQAMITVRTEKYGVFDCKPLAFLWNKFPEAYSKSNTIMFDDLRRNFAMNPQNGLKIRPFRNAHQARATDDELLRLSAYLGKIADLEDLSDLDHDRWEHYMRHHS